MIGGNSKLAGSAPKRPGRSSALRRLADSKPVETRDAAYIDAHGGVANREIGALKQT
jgi:hypothetical protein